MTILAVDDEPLVLTLVATALQENGFQVLKANCAAQAMAIFREHAEDVDLLISDIVMPGMDGPSLAAALRKARPDLEVLLMSGYCDARHLEHGFEFMPKPFSLPEMVARVRLILRNRRSARPPQNRRKAEPVFAAARAN